MGGGGGLAGKLRETFLYHKIALPARRISLVGTTTKIFRETRAAPPSSGGGGGLAGKIRETFLYHKIALPARRISLVGTTTKILDLCRSNSFLRIGVSLIQVRFNSQKNVAKNSLSFEGF
ncbi:hypothetical protein DLM75_14245 [Leptospira stimsonii]|uniref:Uncharacterized protein n=1 Tax=Leptospira stimsonii TaxID=2202203 RepID=A0A396Z3S7_9LEPT|nr:hypothetical protein DLM75_14245 [Leptospira stimsonii]